MAEGKNAIKGEDATVIRNNGQPFCEETAPSGEEYESSKPEDGHTTVWLVLTALTCFLGSSFQFGYNLGVVNAPKDTVEEFFAGVENFGTFIWPTAVAIFAIGGMIGALLGPHVAKLIGRKKTLMANNFNTIIGGILLFTTKTTNSIYVLITGRLLVGINAGVNTVVVPMYLSEVAPVNLRGALGTLHQFGVISGLFISQILGLEMVLGTKSGWPYLFGITAAISVIQLCVLPFCLESPRYLLIIAGKEDEAVRVLQRLRGIEDVSHDITEMKIEKEQEDSEAKVSILGLFRSPLLRRPLFIGIVMQLAQQLCGINGVLFYSTDVFKNVGMSLRSAQAATTGVGAVSVLMTAIVVKLVEVHGRRTLMLWGLGGMAIFYICMTIAFVQSAYKWARIASVIVTLALVIVFQLGPGPIPWFIVAELFSQGPLPAAISVSGMINWFSCFLVGISFPSIQENIKPYTFVPFTVLVLLFWLFTFYFLPETKGRTIHDIMKGLKKKSYGATGQTKDVSKSSNVKSWKEEEKQSNFKEFKAAVVGSPEGISSTYM